jgi:hypothetical protein
MSAPQLVNPVRDNRLLLAHSLEVRTDVLRHRVNRFRSVGDSDNPPVRRVTGGRSQDYVARSVVANPFRPNAIRPSQPQAVLPSLPKVAGNPPVLVDALEFGPVLDTDGRKGVLQSVETRFHVTPGDGGRRLVEGRVGVRVR